MCVCVCVCVCVCADGEFIKWPRPIKNGKGGGGMKLVGGDE